MKKHLSLFLALLLLFSALLAFPAEAVQPEPMQEDTMVSTRQEIQAPRATDLYGTGDAIMYVPGDSSCSHTYKIVPWNYTQHKKYCTKCGYAVFYNHSSFRIITTDGTKHYCYCGVCGDFALNHIKGYRDTNGNGMYHVIYCKQCGVTIDLEQHAPKAGTSVCKCGYRFK